MSVFKKIQAKAQAQLGTILSDTRTTSSSRPVRTSDKPSVMDMRDRFVIRDAATNTLRVEGTGEVVRFASLCAPELFDNDRFEQDDTMRTIAGFGRWPVTRSYTLTVKSWRISRGHINGWDPVNNDFIYDEEKFKAIDRAVASAYENGVRLIIPIINQDYGSEETNWVGNTTDLIRLRRGCGYEEAKRINWWTHPECLDSMFKIINKLLMRTNHVTQVLFCKDPTILAWETGNEMNCGGLSPAPGSWTVRVAEHIKSLADKTLVMDGSFARTDSCKDSYPEQVLCSEAVDIISWHHYGYGEKKRVKEDCQIARKAGKVFVSGEYGFFHNSDEFRQFLAHCDSNGVTGSLAWSLRPHSSRGGFKTHGEGNNIWSYHAPGWPCNGPEWDGREQSIIAEIRCAAFKLTNDPTPNHPIPISPKICKRDHDGTFTWLGSSWACSYELWVNIFGNGEQGWECFWTGLLDNVKEGLLGHRYDEIFQKKGVRGCHIKMRGISVEGNPGSFSQSVYIP